jgi:hypothetical protein
MATKFRYKNEVQRKRGVGSRTRPTQTKFKKKKKKISLHVFLLLKRIRRIQGKCLSAYGEYGEFRVVCGTQNCLRICGKNLCILLHGEEAKRHKTVNISFNNNMNFNFF